MNDIRSLLRTIAMTARETPVIAVPDGVPPDQCRELLGNAMIRGYVARARPSGAAEGVAGWWVSWERGAWHLIHRRSSVLLFLGPASLLGSRMLLIALRAGYREIWLPDGNDRVRRHGVVRLLGRRLWVAVRARIRTFRKPQRDSAMYEAALEDLYSEIGDHFRIDGSAFVPGTALMVLGSLGPGGSERQCALTAIGLAQRGSWRPRVVCSTLQDDSSFFRATVESAGVEVHGLPRAPAGMSDSRVQQILERMDRRYGPEFRNLADVILRYACYMQEQRPSLVQTWMDDSNVIGGIAADLVGVPGLVLSGRSVAPDNFPLLRPFMRPGYRALLRRRTTTAMTNNSVAGAADYTRWLGVGGRTISVISNGFDFPAQRPTEERRRLREQLEIPQDAPVVGSLMRISEEKQPLLWVETAAIIAAHVPTACFLVFGTGALLADMKQQVAGRGLSRSFRFPGLTQDVWPALCAMDVFLLTSRMEGLSNALIEAQAMGVPVVSTGQGGASEAYVDGDTGMTASPAVAPVLAAHVTRLLRSPELHSEMSKRAWAHVRQSFGLATMIESTAALFDAVSSGRPEALVRHSGAPELRRHE